MKTSRVWKAGLLLMASTLVCTPALAQPRHLHHRRPVAVVNIAAYPAPHLGSSYTQKERHALAVNYLEKHKYLTIKKYAKMTKLSLAAAEAELNSFARGKRSPIRPVIRKGKKVYVLG
jgi:hypothetical protein